MRLTRHRHFMVDHIHLPITLLQNSMLKRSSKRRETREKLEKIRSVSLEHAKSCISQPLPAVYALCKDTWPWPTSSCPLAALAALGKGARASHKPPRRLGTFGNCGECHQSRPRGVFSALGCRVHHAHSLCCG